MENLVVHTESGNHVPINLDKLLAQYLKNVQYHYNANCVLSFVDMEPVMKTAKEKFSDYVDRKTKEEDKKLHKA